MNSNTEDICSECQHDMADHVDEREAFAILYGEVCNVIERNYQEIPLDEPGPYHTSKEARAAANRIFEILGIEPDF